MTKKDKTGRQLERGVEDAYRRMGARKVQHDCLIAGNQIDVYVELETAAGSLHRAAVEARDRASPVGIKAANDFAAIVKLLRAERLIDQGVMVSTTGFSKQAREAAKAHGIELLTLADLEARADKAEKPGPRVAIIPPPPQPYFAHPYPMQPHFTGRVAERKMLTQWLTDDDHPVFCSVAIGGMGKSALTWAWVHRDVLGLPLPGTPEDKCEGADQCRVPEARCPEGVMWWSFYDRESSFAGFLDKALIYASAGQVDPSSIPSAYDKVQALLSLLQQHRFLIVLDGFERELRAYAGLSAAYQGDQLPKGTKADLYACIDPHAGDFLRCLASLYLQSRVLITSRLFPRELENLAGCRREDLEAMHPEDALLFFQSQRIRCTRAEIEDACGPYGYHPLALRLLAGVIVKDRRKPGDIQVAKRYPVLPELKGKEHHHILQVSYNTLDRKKRELLSRVAAFRSPMTYDTLGIFNTYKREKKFNAALDELTARGLLLYDANNNRYDLHPIIRQHAYERLTDKTGVHTRLRDHFAAVPAPDEDEVQSVDDLAPVIELYHHTVQAGHYDEARGVLRDRLVPNPLYYRFGAYQTCIELLRTLFPDGQDHPPRLKEESAQAWTLNELANSYSLSGHPRRAVPLFEMSNAIDEARNNKHGVAIGLANLADDQLKLGDVDLAEKNLRRRIDLCRETKDEFREAVGHQELGRLLAYRGVSDESHEELAASTAYWKRTNHKQGLCVTEAYRAIRALLMDDPRAALGSSRRSLEFWEKHAAENYPVERDFVRAHWLIGASHAALAPEKKTGKTKLLKEAETHLTEALTRCRRINLVDLEPDILLSWARWHHAKGDTKSARDSAEEALRIADRCEYRLKQADIHNFLARLDLESGNKEAALAHAQTAYERARCDGLSHCYKPALDEAKTLLKALNATPNP